VVAVMIRKAADIDESTKFQSKPFWDNSLEPVSHSQCYTGTGQVDSKSARLADSPVRMRP
jgi:hypothetical protein